MRRANCRCRPRPNAGRISIFRDGSRTFCPPLHFTGSAFRNEVWKLPCGIPYGSTTTYGEPAAQPARKRSRSASAAGPQARPSHMSAQAVDGAVGKNRDFDPRPLPPRRRRERKPDGLRGRHRKKNPAFRAGGRDAEHVFRPQESAGAYPERKGRRAALPRRPISDASEQRFDPIDKVIILEHDNRDERNDGHNLDEDVQRRADRNP